MSQPTRFVPNNDYSVDIVPGDEGNALDQDFADVKLTTDGICDNLALLQRDDGALHNGIVTPDSLTADTAAMVGDWVPRGAWLTATSYSAFNFVTQSGIGYLCLVAHVSGTFATDLAAGKWTAISKVDSVSTAFALTVLAGANASAWLTTLGVTTFIKTLLDDVDAPAGRATLDVPSNAAMTAAIAAFAVPLTLADAKGDLILGSAADAFVRKGAPTNGWIMVADSAQAGGWTFRPAQQRSLAPNPFFQIDQRVNSAASRADDTYCLDRWYVLTQSNPIAVTQQSAQEDGQATNVRLSQSNAAAQRMGIATIIEGKDSKPLRGRNYTFVPRVRCSISQPIRYAVLEWTGTEDAVTSDVVNNWASGTYTPNNFFLAANLNVISVGAITPAANTWTDVDAVIGGFGSTLNNVILFAWTEGTIAQNATLDVGKVRFVEGSWAGDILVPRFIDELTNAKRFYFKTFPYATAPATGTTGPGAMHAPVIVAGAVTNSIVGMIDLGTPMRLSNSGVFTFYNPFAANAFAYNITKSTSATATSATNFGDQRFAVQCTGLAGWAVGDMVAVHATVDMEL